MAWYPGATKMELQPESDAQPAIRPTQLIMHSIAAPWTARRMYEYWRDSTTLDSHFGLGFDGDLGQYIGTETRADANYLANRRPDGTGAVSIETASNLKHTDPWTPEQIEALIRLGVWMHQQHSIPLRICRTASDPGFGYHRLHPEWSTDGTACPGDARVAQFNTVVFPGIVARATGQTTEEDDMPLTDDDAKKVASAVWGQTFQSPTDPQGTPRSAATFLRWADVRHQREMTQLAALSASVEALAKLVGQDVDTEQVVTAVRQAIADAVIKVDVDVTGTPAT